MFVQQRINLERSMEYTGITVGILPQAHDMNLLAVQPVCGYEMPDGVASNCSYLLEKIE